MGKFIDLTGKTFGRLVVIKRAEGVKGSGTFWLCECSCGSKTIVSVRHLRDGHTSSCGCLVKEMTGNLNRTHGMCRTSIYGIWGRIKDRCLKPSDKAFKNYGGRGITICPRWKDSFENFYADMGDRPEGMTIERIDNNKGYSPGNCKWATRKEQMRNMRLNRLVKYNGKTRCLVEWAEKFGIRYGALRDRLNMGWTMERALTQEIRQGKYNAGTQL